MKTKILIILSIAVAIILGFIAFDATTAEKLCQERGGVSYGDVCIMETPIEHSVDDSVEVTSLDEISYMKPDSVEFFYYPNPEYTENRDAFETFMLIRLPEWLDGDAQDASAFRAYSAKALDDSCLVKYWPGEGRQRIENPCQGGMYRVIDGAMTIGLTHRSNPMTALPHLDLSTDENGLLYIEPPKWTKTENGVIGYGREVTHDDIHQGSELIKDSFVKSFPEFSPIPVKFAGYSLAEIVEERDGFEIRYLDFSSKIGGINIIVEKSLPQEQEYFLNLASKNSEFWQIDETVIKIGGSMFEKNNEMPERFKEYVIEFFKDDVKYRITGHNLEFMKKSLVKNFFPENDFENLFLISKRIN